MDIVAYRVTRSSLVAIARDLRVRLRNTGPDHLLMDELDRTVRVMRDLRNMRGF